MTLQNNAGKRVRVVLDNWGAAHDRSYRRWNRVQDAWQWEETGETAYGAGFLPARPQVLK